MQCTQLGAKGLKTMEYAEEGIETSIKNKMHATPIDTHTEHKAKMEGLLLPFARGTF